MVNIDLNDKQRACLKRLHPKLEIDEHLVRMALGLMLYKGNSTLKEAADFAGLGVSTFENILEANKLADFSYLRKYRKERLKNQNSSTT